MDRPVPAGAMRDTGSIKSILFYVHEDDALEDRLQLALSLARACSAHLELLGVTPVEAYTMIDTYGGTFMSAEIDRILEDQAEKLRSRVEARLGNEDVSWDYRSVTSNLAGELIGSAALADLVVLGREPRFREFGRTGVSLAGEFLHKARTPALVPGQSGDPFDPFGPAVIASNGSFEAANAVRAAIGLLKIASRVRVVRFTEKKTAAFPDTSLLEYLSRHGIHADLQTVELKGEAGASLLDYAARADASYLVVGAYSHSRAGEFLFGGVTRDFHRESPISLLMAR
jgi:nucleotide-binding universal stress UspA family protein